MTVGWSCVPPTLPWPEPDPRQGCGSRARSCLWGLLRMLSHLGRTLVVICPSAPAQAPRAAGSHCVLVMETVGGRGPPAILCTAPPHPTAPPRLLPGCSVDLLPWKGKPSSVQRAPTRGRVVGTPLRAWPSFAPRASAEPLLVQNSVAWGEGSPHNPPAESRQAGRRWLPLPGRAASPLWSDAGGWWPVLVATGKLGAGPDSRGAETNPPHSQGPQWDLTWRHQVVVLRPLEVSAGVTESSRVCARGPPPWSWGGLAL